MERRVRFFLNKDIINSYEEIDEEKRLNSSRARKVEFFSTIEALQPYISCSLNCLDLGCGTGVYSIYYADKVKSITAVDLVPNHISRLEELWRKRNYKTHIETAVEDAVDLSCRDSVFDLVLCLGPLYHIPDPQKQKKCINQCIRVTKPRGIIAFSYISPFSVFPCVIRGDISRMSQELVDKIVVDRGLYADDPCCFWTDNYFHEPAALENLLREANLEILDHLATDGQSIAFQSTVNNMTDSEFDIWMDYHRKICRNPSVLGTSNHGLIITRKRF